MQVRYPRAGAAAALLAVLALPACTPDTQVDTSGGQPRPTTAAPSSAASTVPAVTPAPESPTPSRSASSPLEAAILAQYREYFATLVSASRAKPAERRDLLSRVAVDPSLNQTLEGMAAAEAFGEVSFGTIIVHPTLVKVNGSTATVRDCQDGSGAGRRSAATGKLLVVGSKNDFAVATVKRAADGVWRVATVEYQPAGSCNVNA